MGGRGNHRSFGGLKFRRLLKAFILGNGNKIPLRRSCSTKDADEGPDEPDLKEFFEPLVEKTEEIPCQTEVVTPSQQVETKFSFGLNCSVRTNQILVAGPVWVTHCLVFTAKFRLPYFLI